MRKVNLFTTIFAALLLTVFSLTAAEAKVYKNTDNPAIGWVDSNGKKGKAPTLTLLSFEQLARLNDVKRAQYLALIRKAAFDLDKIQRSFKGLHVVALAEKTQQELFAYTDIIEAAFGQPAYADQTSNTCMSGGGVSSYPADKVKAGRAPFQCTPITCEASRRIDGSKCDWSTTGLNGADACQLLQSPLHASKACYDKSKALEKRDDAKVKGLVASVNEYYGYKPNGTYTSTTCKSDTAKNLMTSMLQFSHHTLARAMLIKTLVFCNTSEVCQQASKTDPNASCVPDGLPDPSGILKRFEYKKMAADYNSVNTAIVGIYSKVRNHCLKELSKEVIDDLASEKNLKLNLVPKHSEPWEMEKLRINYLACTKGAAPTPDMNDEEIRNCTESKGQKPMHANVLEVEECRHSFLAFNDLKRAAEELNGTFPRLSDVTPPPEVPPGPTNGEIVDVEPSGCSENVGKDESQLAQAAARCMPCLIQSHEAKKTGKRDYIPSKKFLSLMSTLALACGDGQANDTTVNPQLMMDYWMAFGHCSNQTYEWRGTEDKALVSAWGEKSGRPFWKKGNGSKDASTHPDRGGSFNKAYGLSLDTAKKLFCDPNGKSYNYTASASEKARFLKTRREQFNQEKKVLERGQENSIADSLMACMNEASSNASQFVQGSNTYSFADTTNTASPAFQCAQNDWLKNGYPTIMNRGGSCFIAKQIERYKVGCNGADICQDRIRDGKRDGIDDISGCKCGGTATYMVYVNPGFNDKEYRVRVEARENGQLVPDVNRRPNQPSADPESIAYLDGGSCKASAVDASDPATKTRNAK